MAGASAAPVGPGGASSQLALAVGVAAALALSACSITAWLHGLLSVSAQHPLPEGMEAEWGVVLGYALHRNGSCTRPLQSRVEVGVAAWEARRAARLIFSGAHPGRGLRNVSEANAMAAYAAGLVAQPPPAGRWLLEEQSTSTRTNAIYSLAIVAQRRPQQAQQGPGNAGHEQAPPRSAPASVLLVTNPFHQLRSFLTFRRAAQQAGLSIQLYVAAAPFAGHRGWGSRLLDGLMDQLDFWRELAALAYYGARGWL